MIDEAVLERLLAEEAQTYEVPEDGPQMILDVAAEDGERGPRRTPWLAAAAAAVVLAVGVPLVTTAGDDPMPASRGGSYAVVDGAAQTYDSGGKGDLYGEPSALNDPAVVRTGDVFLAVPGDDVAETLLAAARIAGKYGGFVAESNTETSGDHPQGHVLVRVPVASFDRAVEDAKRLGDVAHASTRSEDVSGEITDTAARLRSLTATRAQLQSLLKRAASVSEVLAVQERITEVQTEIEKLQAERESLADKTTFGALRVTVGSPGGGEQGRFERAWDEAVGGFNGGFEWLVSVSGRLAFGLIVVAVALVAGRRAYRYWVRGVI